MKEYRCDNRTALAEELIKLEPEFDRRIIWLDADLMASSGIKVLAVAFPDRVIDCGIQEANMFGTAAGLSEEGFLPFVHSFSAFTSRRMADQIFMSGIYAKENVRIIGSDPGICAGPNGGTHISLEDIGILRSMPGTVILDPCDAPELMSVVRQTLEAPGIYYIRLTRKSRKQFYEEGTEFRIGKANILREGNDAAILTAGTTCVSASLEAAGILEQQGIHARVLDCFTIKPLDRDAVLRAVQETGNLVTVENHNICNGLGSAVSEVIAESGMACKFTRLGARDRAGEVGNEAYLSKLLGFDADAIVKIIQNQA